MCMAVDVTLQCVLTEKKNPRTGVWLRSVVSVSYRRPLYPDLKSDYCGLWDVKISYLLGRAQRVLDD